MPPTRREAISLFGLGAGTPSRFPYPGRPQPSPGIGPSQGQVVRARQVIVSGADGGVFVYSGPPAAGNLIATITGQAGTDQYGNVYLQGIADYAYIGSTPVTAVRILGGQINFFNWTGSSWGSAVAVVGTGGTTVLQLQGATSVTVPGVPFTSGAGTLAAPTVVTTDTWHQVPAGSFQNGWVGNANLDYRLAADDTIEINGRVTNAAGTAGGSIITTLPAGYAPANRVEFVTLTDSNGTAHSLQLDTSGHLQLNTAIAAGGTADIAWRCPRSAPA